MPADANKSKSNAAAQIRFSPIDNLDSQSYSSSSLTPAAASALINTFVSVTFRDLLCDPRTFWI